MSIRMGLDIKRWTAKRESALVLGVTRGKAIVAEASRAYDLSGRPTDFRSITLAIAARKSHLDRLCPGFSKWT